ncbi:DNA primase [Porticoccaceae bacterium]|nr:DNA primase [Porticoccaceae bacterium]
MARIPDDVVDQVKSAVDLKLEIEKATGQTFKKSGSEWTTKCISPSHDDKKVGNFQIFNKNGTDVCYCHSCGFGGDIFNDKVREAIFGNEAFPALVSRLGAQHGIHVPDTRAPVTERDKKLWAQKKKIADCLSAATTIYQSALKSSLPALNYFKDRGINDATADHFRLGYSTDGWKFLYDQLKSAYSLSALKTSGLIKENDKGNRWDFFRERYMFPIRNLKGETVSFGGRITDKGSGAKYLNGPESPVYVKKNVLYGMYESLNSKSKPKSFVVVEGYVDVVLAHQHGHTNHVAPCGTALAQSQLNSLFKHAESVTLAFDGDTAGHNAAWRACKSFIPHLEAGKIINVVFLPDGEDSASMLLSDPEGYSRLLSHPSSLTSYYFDRLLAGDLGNSVEGLAGLMKEASNLISTIKDPNLKALFESEADERFQVKQGDMASTNDANTYRKHLTKKHVSLLNGASLESRQISACLAANPILALAMPEQIHKDFEYKSRQPSLSSDNSAHLLTFAYKASMLASQKGVPTHKVTKTDNQYLLKYLEIKGSDYLPVKQAETVSRYVSEILNVLPEPSLENPSDQRLGKKINQQREPDHEPAYPTH